MFGTDHKVKKLGAIELFSDLSPEDIKRIAATGDMVSTQAGDKLPGRSFFLLLSGEAVLDGERTLQEGDSFGAAELLDEADEDHDLQMTADGDVLVFGEREFNYLLLTIPGFSKGIGRQMSNRLREVRGTR